MKRIILAGIIIGASVLIFISGFMAGAAFGAYYRTELLVLWRGFFPIDFIQQLPPATTPNDQLKISTVINLPKMSEALPLLYSDTLAEDKIQELLKYGAVVLPLGVSFGEPGNVVVTAHSSGTAAFGPFRFAFAQLSDLTAGDEFTITSPTASYRYKVYAKEVVWPHEVDKLPRDERSTVTLVTCWPLWTNFKRLLVHSELIGTDYKI